VHRIGRTGRAGRSGEAILFVTPRERNLLRAIERATRQPIEQMQLPSVEAVNDQRIAKFKTRIAESLATGGLSFFQQLIEQYEQENNVPAVEIAAALARIAQGDIPLLLEAPPKRDFVERAPREHDSRPRREFDAADRDRRPPPSRDGAPSRAPRAHATEHGKRTYRLEVGHDHGVKPGNIIGAIANEGNIESQFIGRLSIRGHYSLIDLPDGMPPEVFTHLKKVWVSGQQMHISEWNGQEEAGSEVPAAPPRRFGGAGGAAGKPPRGPRPPGNRPPRRT